jgi:hypothetical protein
MSYLKGIDMKVLVGLISGICAASIGHAAVTFSSAQVSGSINPTTATFGPGEAGTPSSAFGGFTHAFEIEAATLANSIWALNPSIPFAVASSNAGTFNFAAASGYVINAIALRGGGNWATGPFGTVSSGAILSANGNSASGGGVFAVSPNNIPLATGGRWEAQTSTISFAGGVANVIGNYEFILSRGGPSLVAGLDDEGVLGGTILASTFTQSAEAYLAPTILLSVSAIPEPGEWAMMLAGVGTICAIARRRKSLLR